MLMLPVMAPTVLAAKSVLTVQLTIKSGAACAGIHWSGGTFYRVNPSLLADLEYFDDLRRIVDVPDGLLVQLPAVSATAIRQPRRWLETIRWRDLFIGK